MKKRPEHNILIVDDDRDMCLSLADVISLDGNYKASFTSKPRKAIEMVRKKSYSLVITDYKMPKIDGLETIKSMKEIRPEIPVIMLTAFISIELVEKAREAGAVEVLSKFIWPDELLRHVERAVKKAVN